MADARESSGITPGLFLVSQPQFEAMMTMCIDSGDMTPMARHMLRKLMDEEHRIVETRRGAWNAGASEWDACRWALAQELADDD